MDVDSQRAGELFEATLSLTPAARGAFLEAACANDPALKQRVEEMLQAEAEGGSSLKEHSGTIRIDVDRLVATSAEGPGSIVGRYKLLQKLGEGGCGVVYMAEQTEPVRRRVALKVIKRGMDTRHVIARFEAERQALAMMNHPNIAKVFDAGETEAGRPFFVMELVQGMPITDYCDQEKLRSEDRLKLFVQVCQAIQHAHQKGIIHRDIKPSNVLVAFEDGKPVPKVIDFGIAKATEVRLTEKTLYTALAQFMGTPAYMSPEQAEMSSIDIDTRSDIYSLGVLLYELLTGTTPFDTRELLAAGIDEIRRKIRDEEPPKPSTRLGTLSDKERTSVATRRSCDPPKLIHQVSGDLDWVVMKALEKDRTRRYETANGFAADIQRHLNQEPVTAGPISATYRMQKLIRRNKLAFSAVSAVAVILLLGGGFSTWQAIRATRAVKEQMRLRANEANLLQKAERARMEEANARKQAETNAVEVKNLLRAAYIANSSSQAERGDVAGSLPWLVEALKLSAPGSATEKAIRMNINMVTQRTLQLQFAKAFEKNEAPGAYSEYSSLDSPRSNVALSPDGRRVGIIENTLTPAGQRSASIVLFDLMTGSPKGKPFSTEGQFDDLHFSPDGLLIMGSGPAGARVWDINKGELIAKLGEQGDESSGIVSGEFTHDSASLLVISSRRGILWDLKGGKELSGLDFNFQDEPTKAQALVGSLTTYGARWSSDGRFLAYARDGERAEDNWIWEARSQQRIPFPRFKGRIHSLKFSPDGKLLVCFCSQSPLIRIVDIGRGEFVQAAEIFSSEMPNAWEPARTRAAFSQDSTRLIFFGAETSPQIWDTRSWLPLGVPLKHASRPIRAVFNLNGTKLATLAESGILQLWDTQTGYPSAEPLENPFKLDPRSLGGADFNFSNDGQSLVFANRGAVSIFRVPQPETRFFPSTNKVTAVELSPDGKQILVLTANSNSVTDAVYGLAASIMDVLSGEKKWRVSDVSKAVWSFDGKTILTEESFFNVRLLDAARGIPITSSLRTDFSSGEIPNDLYLSMDCEVESATGGVSRYTGWARGDTGVWPETGAQLNLPLKFTLLQLHAEPVPRSEEKAKIELNDSRAPPTYAILNPDRNLLLLGRSDNTFRAYALTNGMAVGPSVRLTGRVKTVCFSLDHHRIAILCADRSIGCWSVDLVTSSGYVTNADHKVLRPIGSYADTSVSFSTNGAYLITRGGINRITETPAGRIGPGDEAYTIWQVFDASDMRELFRPPAAVSLGYGQTKSASSQGLRGITNNFARVFDVKTSKLVTPTLNHSAPVLDVKLSSDERFVATGSEDGTARVWDADSGEPVTPPLRHSAAVTAVAFFPDSSRLLTGAADGSLRVWVCKSADDSVEDLGILADVNAGRRVDQNGVLVPLEANEMQSILRLWSKKHPPRFATSEILQKLESQLQVWEVLFKLRKPNASIVHIRSSATLAQGRIGAKVEPAGTMVPSSKQNMNLVIEKLKEGFLAIGEFDSAREDRLNELQQAADRLP